MRTIRTALDDAQKAITGLRTELEKAEVRIEELEDEMKLKEIVIDHHAIDRARYRETISGLKKREIVLPTEEEILKLVDRSYKAADNTNIHIEGRVAYQAIVLTLNFIRKKNGGVK